MSRLRPLRELEPRDRRPAAWAATQFACVMTANFVLRAVREEMGVQGGVDNLPWLFTATFVGTLLLVPAYGWAAGRWGRRQLSRGLYLGLALSLLLPLLAWVLALVPVMMLRRAVFVWLSVINMIAVAGFWAAVVDVWRGERAPRVYALVAAGGTVGALVGPALALGLVDAIGPHGLLLVGAIAWVLAASCGEALERALRERDDVPDAARPMGGSSWAGLRDVIANPALRGLAIWILAYTATSTALYLMQARIVGGAIASPEARTALFARVDLGVNILALALQLTLTGRVLARARLATVLSVLPGITVLLALALATVPLLGVLVLAQLLRRACEHGFAKPARELLYAATPRETKFKGQNALDTLVYRGGDVISAWAVQALASVTGITGVGLATAGIGAGWWWFSRRLAARRSPGEAHDRS